MQAGAVCGIGAGPDAGVGHPVSRERRWLEWCCISAAPSSRGRLVLAGWLGRVSREVLGGVTGFGGYPAGLLLAVSLSSLAVASPWAEWAGSGCQSRN